MKLGSRWGWGLAMLLGAGLALLLSVVLSLVASGPQGNDRFFLPLFWVNLLAASLLALLVLAAAGRLVLRWREGRFGSRLLLKLAGIFALVGLVPGALIYTVSYQFVSSSVENWFDTRVDRALNAGLTLGKTTLDTQAQDLAQKTRSAAERLADTHGVGELVALERLREQLDAESASILGANGHVLHNASANANFTPERPPAALLRQARQQRQASQVEGLDDEAALAAGTVQGQVRALAGIPSTSFALASASGGERYLMVVRSLPRALIRDALTVQTAYSEYQQRHLARDGLRRLYIGTLTLSLVLSVLGALLLAVVLGNQLARPLLLLAEGMQQVAAGDLGAKPVFASRDEIGGLTRSFARMTEQLGSARAQAERSLHQLESARARLQTILDSMTGGVLMFDREQRIDTVNPAACRILRSPLAEALGRPLGEVAGLAELAEAIHRHFEQHQEGPDGAPTADAASGQHSWQDTLALRLGTEDDQITLLLRGAVLPGAARLVVFDDISDVVSAQRSQAWAEVARRVAHEIKNPLTPIQLSAERLQHKLGHKLAEPADQAMLVRSVTTIVTQVQAMQKLVNEFRDYARLPSAQMQATDLNALVADVLGLYGDAIEQGRLRVATSTGLPALRGDPSQLRQVIHNLLQNALDAVAGQPGGEVRLETELARQEDGSVRLVRLKVTDNGPGFSDKVLKRAFEPYVTTKTKGTGLGLAVVKKIADEHGARIRLANLNSPDEDGDVMGAQVSLSFSRFTDLKTSAVMAPAPTT